MGETAGTEGRETPAEVFDRLFLPAMAGPWAAGWLGQPGSARVTASWTSRAARGQSRPRP
jgi:hypothetical protein